MKKYYRLNDFKRGKVYRAVIPTGIHQIRLSHKTFRRATEAEAYADRATARYQRLKDRTLAAVMEVAK